MFGMQRKSGLGSQEKKEAEVQSPVISPSEDVGEIVTKTSVREKEPTNDAGEREFTDNKDVKPKSDVDLHSRDDIDDLETNKNVEPVISVGEVEPIRNVGEIESDEGTDNQVSNYGKNVCDDNNFVLCIPTTVLQLFWIDSGLKNKTSFWVQKN